MSIARELAAPLELGTSLADILSNALPTVRKRNKKSSESSVGFFINNFFIFKNLFLTKSRYFCYPAALMYNIELLDCE